MKTVATVKINQIHFTKRCEAVFNGVNVWVPIINGTVQEVAEAIAERGDDSIAVKVRLCSDPKLAAQDLKTFTRRLHKLAAACGYAASEFAVNGILAVASLSRA